MPIYEYECTSCKKRFELQQKMTDPSIENCSQLGCAEAKPVNKIISAPAIMFKGTGWYVTDYSDKLKEPDAKSENKGEKTEVKSSESKGDSETKSSSDTASTKSGGETNASSTSTTSSESSSPSTSSASSSTGSNSSSSSASSSSTS